MSKYKNKKCEYEFKGEVYRFDSLLEKSHAIGLFKEFHQRKIEDLILQPEFQLCEPITLQTNATKNGKTRQRAITYVADFSYVRDGKKIVADSKGMKTSVYSLKKKLFLSQLKEHRVDEFHEVFKAETITYTQNTTP